MEKEPKSVLRDELRRALTESDINSWGEWQSLDTSRQERLLNTITEKQIVEFVADIDKKAQENPGGVWWDWKEYTVEKKRKVAIRGLLTERVMDAFAEDMHDKPLGPEEEKLLDAVFGPEELNELREAIKNSQEAIEMEFARTQNSWLACLGSRIFQIETFLNTKKIKGFLSPEKFKSVSEKLEILKLTTQGLTADYPTKEESPPKEIRSKLLKELAVVLKQID